MVKSDNKMNEDEEKKADISSNEIRAETKEQEVPVEEKTGSEKAESEIRANEVEGLDEIMQATLKSSNS